MNADLCRSLVKVKWSRYRSGGAQRVGRGIALLFHDRSTRRGRVVSSMPQPHLTPRKDPVPILQEAGWAPGPVRTGRKSCPHRDLIPDCQPIVSRYTDWATRPTCRSLVQVLFQCRTQYWRAQDIIGDYAPCDGTHTLKHAVPHLCRAQYCRVSSVICCHAAGSCFADSMSWLGLKPYILYYFLLSLHKLSIKYYLYIHTPQSKGCNMLNDRNTNRTFSEEDINDLKVKVLPN